MKLSKYSDNINKMAAITSAVIKEFPNVCVSEESIIFNASDLDYKLPKRSNDEYDLYYFYDNKLLSNKSLKDKLLFSSNFKSQSFYDKEISIYYPISVNGEIVKVYDNEYLGTYLWQNCTFSTSLKNKLSKLNSKLQKEIYDAITLDILNDKSLNKVEIKGLPKQIDSKIKKLRMFK